MIRYRYNLIPFIVLFLKLSFATTLVIPADGDVVGEIEYTSPQAGETLAEVGVRYDIGYYEMINANPRVDSVNPLPTKLKLLIPSQFVLPAVLREGIVINLAEYRLYFFPENDNVVITYPVGIGRRGWSTPVGRTSVIAKQINPTWHPSPTLVARASKNGVQIPDTFPPGPGNPLGKHVLRLGWPTYLIHGTNNTDGVGERISAGCIRMLPDDIEYLFEQVKTGTSVRVINEPLKLGHLNREIYIESHPPLLKNQKMGLQAHANNQLEQLNFKGALNRKIINQEISYPSGIPKKITL